MYLGGVGDDQTNDIGLDQLPLHQVFTNILADLQDPVCVSPTFVGPLGPNQVYCGTGTNRMPEEVIPWSTLGLVLLGLVIFSAVTK